MDYFSKGFKHYLESGDYSDLTLISLANETYKVHKIILCKRSAYFRGLIQGGFSESNQSKIQLREPDHCSVFPYLLEWIYTGNLDITEKLAVPLLALSDFYGIADLKAKTSDFVEKNINKDNVCVMMNHSLLYDFADVTKLCADVMTKNLTLIDNLDLEYMDYETFLSILQHPYLRVTSEFKLFEIINQFLLDHEELKPEEANALLEKVSYRDMTLPQLQFVGSLPPHDIMIDALMYNLQKIEFPTGPEYYANQSYANKQRVSCTTIPYRNEDNQHGIIYSIATGGGSQPWVNPHTTGLVRVLASSVAKGEVQNLLKLAPIELWTMDQPSSWFIIDFGENRRVRPTHYTLRHGGNYSSDFIRQWEFGASNDRKSWELLKKHSREETFSSKFAIHSWEVNCPTDKQFRYFRILQTGKNSAHHNFLAINAFELYGDLFEESQK